MKKKSRGFPSLSFGTVFHAAMALLALLLVGEARAGVSAPQKEEFCADPLKEFLSRPEDPDGGLGAYYQGKLALYTLRADINGDGREDVLLTWSWNRAGKQGLDWTVYMGEKNGFKRLDEHAVFFPDSSYIGKVGKSEATSIFTGCPAGGGESSVIEICIKNNKVVETIHTSGTKASLEEYMRDKGTSVSLKPFPPITEEDYDELAKANGWPPRNPRSNPETDETLDDPVKDFFLLDRQLHEDESNRFSGQGNLLIIRCDVDGDGSEDLMLSWNWLTTGKNTYSWTIYRGVKGGFKRSRGNALFNPDAAYLGHAQGAKTPTIYISLPRRDKKGFTIKDSTSVLVEMRFFGGRIDSKGWSSCITLPPGGLAEHLKSKDVSIDTPFLVQSVPYKEIKAKYLKAGEKARDQSR